MIIFFLLMLKYKQSLSIVHEIYLLEIIDDRLMSNMINYMTCAHFLYTGNYIKLQYTSANQPVSLRDGWDQVSSFENQLKNETRLGHKCQTPVRSSPLSFAPWPMTFDPWPLSIAPYPLSLFHYPLSLSLVPYPLVLILSRNLGEGSSRTKTGVW